MVLLGVFITVMVAMHYLVVSRVQGALALNGLFVFSQWIMVIGTLMILDENDERDMVYAAVSIVPLVIYIVVSMLLFLTSKADPPFDATKQTRPLPLTQWSPGVMVYVVIVLSCGISALYFAGVGYNVFLLGVDALLNGGQQDRRATSALRLDAYAGATYFFPGYVNQFKNILLPSLSLVAVYSAFQRRTSWRWLLAVVLSVASVVSLLGTGQRGAFIQFLVTAVIFLLYVDRARFRRRLTITIVLAAPLLFIATLILGRSASALASSTDSISRVGVVGSEIFKRVFGDNQSAGRGAFWYVYPRPTQFGADWASTFVGMIPGVANPLPDVSQEVFRIMYGSPRGTAPPSMWTSVYYNFSWIGLVVAPVLLAVVYRWITYKGVSRPARSPLETVGMAGVFAIGGTWIAGGPEYLLNAGFATYAVVWWFGRRSTDRWVRNSTSISEGCPTSVRTSTNPVR